MLPTTEENMELSALQDLTSWMFKALRASISFNGPHQPHMGTPFVSSANGPRASLKLKLKSLDLSRAMLWAKWSPVPLWDRPWTYAVRNIISTPASGPVSSQF